MKFYPLPMSGPSVWKGPVEIDVASVTAPETYANPPTPKAPPAQLPGKQ